MKKPRLQQQGLSILLQGRTNVYTSRSNGEKNLSPDYVLYNGALWEVKYTMPYQNLGFHVECVAVKLPESEKQRITGEVFGRK